MTIQTTYQDPDLKYKWPTTLVNYIDVVTAQLKSQNINNADEVALGVVLALGNYGGGRIIYLPKGDRLKLAVRNKSIWDHFTGDNTATLASEYRLTTMQIYSIIKQQRQLHLKKVQAKLL